MEEEEEIFTALRQCWYRVEPAGNNKFIIFVRFGSSYTCSWEIPDMSKKTIKENVEKAQIENEEYIDLHRVQTN